MALRRLVSRSAVSASLLVAGCSGGGGGTPAPPTIVPLVSTIPGPYSQVYTPVGGTAFTVTSVKITYVPYGTESQGSLTPYRYLRIDTTFAQDISNALPAPGTSPTLGTQLALSTGLDSDNNSSTGQGGVGCPGFPGDTQSGIDFYIDNGSFGGRLADGNYALVDIQSGTDAHVIDEVSTSVSGNTLTQMVNLISVGAYQSAPKIGISMQAQNGADLETSGSEHGQCIPTSGEFVTNQ